MRAGIIASTFANVLRGKKGKRRTPADFMPFEKPQRKKERSAKVIEAEVRNFFGQLVEQTKLREEEAKKSQNGKADVEGDRGEQDDDENGQENGERSPGKEST